jgi:hypothetical protein
METQTLEVAVERERLTVRRLREFTVNGWQVTKFMAFVDPSWDSRSIGGPGEARESTHRRHQVSGR